MSKYIKLEEAEKLLTNALRIAQGFDEPLERSLVDLPTIEIVHCKECKYWRTDEKVRCRLLPYADANDYCSYGERIEE